MKDKIENEPLLYIDQPRLQEQISFMQSTFRSAKDNLKQAKSAIETEIDHILNLPSEVASMTCEIITAKATIKGTIVSQQADSILIQDGQETAHHILKKDIQDIRYISF